MRTYTYTVYTSILGCSLAVTAACEISCWAPKTERVLLVTGWGSILTHSKLSIVHGLYRPASGSFWGTGTGPQVGLGLVLCADAKTECAARCFPHPRTPATGQANTGKWIDEDPAMSCLTCADCLPVDAGPGWVCLFLSNSHRSNLVFLCTPDRPVLAKKCRKLAIPGNSSRIR